MNDQHAPRPNLRRRRRLLITGFIAAALFTPLACELSRWQKLPETFPLAQTLGSARETDSARQATTSLSEWISSREVTGVAACVAVAGETVWCGAQGWADVQHQQPLLPTTSMKIGSVSKTLTAIILARLEERGAVDLDLPISRYAADLPPHLGALTLRQLASHTAGVRHYRWRFAWPPHETWSNRRYGSVEESLSVFQDDGLLFEPGAGFQYSTHGFTLLGAVLEQATGLSYPELLQRELVTPFDLTSTTLEGLAPVVEQATAYETLAGRYRGAMRVDNSRCWPGGGIYSSAQDLARLASRLPTGTGLQPETLERFLEPQKLPDGSDNPQRYALGWRIAKVEDFGHRESYRIAHHGGVASGGSAFLVLFPDDSVAAAVVTNTRTGSRALMNLAFDTAELFLPDGDTGGVEGEGLDAPPSQ